MTDTASLEERVSALEARLVAPLATAPPITIGSLTNVPVPGSQIAAQWAQDASGMVVHRFANKAALDAWTAAPTGAHAVTIDTGILWRRVAGGWLQITPWTANAPGTAQVPSDTTPLEVSRITIPAAPALRVVNATCSIRVDVVIGYTASIRLRIDGTLQCLGIVDALDSGAAAGSKRSRYVTCSAMNVQLPAGRAIAVTAELAVTAGYTAETIGLDATQNRLDCTVFPVGY